MAILFVLLLFFTLIHFIYQAILLPGMRTSSRFQLFELRDKLRLLKMKFGDRISGQVYEYMQDSINISLRCVSIIHISQLIKTVNIIKKDSVLQQRVAEKKQLIDNCNVEEIQSMRDQMARILARAFVSNIGMLCVYLLPIALVCVVVKGLKDYIKGIFAELISCTEREAEQILPTTHACC